MLELGGRNRCQKTHKTPFAEFERSNVKSERERERILKYGSMNLSLKESGKAIPLREMGQMR